MDPLKELVTAPIKLIIFKNMKNYQEVIGIDVSKNKLDAYAYHRGSHREFSNDVSGYKSLLKWAHVKTQKEFFCFENTGHYSLKLALYLSSKKKVYVQENPVVIKRSSGVIREKNDVVDAIMIARYGWLHREELRPSELKDKELLEVGRLLALRDQLVRSRTGLKNTLSELKKLLSSSSTDTCCKTLVSSITHLNSQIKKLEHQLQSILKESEHLSENYRLITSLKGVGLVVGSQLLYHTNNFKRFKSWRQFSSYCGTAPFGHSSGSNIHKRRKCHPMGDRQMKSLLSMAACTAIQHDSELRLYYKKKREEGKLRMIALNNVRNKLISRVFAVVKRGTPYVELHKFAA